MSDSAKWYNPKRDGTLDAYLKTHDGLTSFPLFRGHAQYETLKNEGYLIPEFTKIRLMWNAERGDEHFEVNQEYLLVGLEARMHSGRQGIHEPERVLNEGPCWEAYQLETSPARRLARRKELMRADKK